MVRRLSVVVVRRCRPSLSLTISNIFSETACLIKAKIYAEPPWVGGTKVCSRYLGHMTKMAATPIYEPLRIEIDLMTCDVQRANDVQKQRYVRAFFRAKLNVVC